MDTQLNLTADAERRREEHVERIVHGAFARVLDRHHAEVGCACLHLVEAFLDRDQRQRPHRMPEVLEHRLLGKGALRPEKAHLERLLLRETGGHDLAKETQDLLVPQRPTLAAVALERLVQDLGFAFRPVEIDGVAVDVLGNANLAGKTPRVRL